MKTFSKIIKIFFLILIICNILLSAYWLMQSDIHYDVDVSRDFLVMNDIVKNHHFTLLGPRSGAIPGIFHGPLWFYINLPVFYIGSGDPLIVGWFWFLLSIFSLLIVYWVAKKLFGFQVAILSVLLFSANSIVNPSIGLKNFYNPYGAVFLFPIFFFLFYRYINTLRMRYLTSSLFLLGLIIQFQMAFGIPVLIATIILLGYFLIQKKKLTHLLSYFILLLPLSTFILFDIKHQGLQFNSLIHFISHKSGFSPGLLNLFGDRIHALAFDSFDQFSPGKNLLTIFYAIFFFCGFIVAFKKNKSPQKTTYFLFGYFFLFFWVVSLFYSGGVGNYSWPFLPVMVIIFCSFITVVKRELFIIMFCLLYLINLYTGISAILDFKSDVNQRGPHSWAFNLQIAKKIYTEAKGNFGYYTFSPDRFAYQQRYAMIYVKRFFPNISSASSAKKPLTYLIEVDPPKDRPELNGINWRISDVGISRPPDQLFRFDFIQVEKYFLNNDEIKIKANPYLLDNVFIR